MIDICGKHIHKQQSTQHHHRGDVDVRNAAHLTNRGQRKKQYYRQNAIPKVASGREQPGDKVKDNRGGREQKTPIKLKSRHWFGLGANKKLLKKNVEVTVENESLF